jgi:hypothetical protein
MQMFFSFTFEVKELELILLIDSPNCVKLDTVSKQAEAQRSRQTGRRMDVLEKQA